MSDAERGDGLTTSVVLHRQLARSVWKADPLVRLFHYPEQDTLVAELIDAPAVAEELLHGDALLVTFDGRDARAFPTSLVLTGFRRRPDSDAADEARRLLGPEVWSVAEELDRESVEAEVPLTTAGAARRLAAWSDAARRILPSRAIGFELRPGLLRAALVDAAGTRLGQEEMGLDAMDPGAVVRATGALTASLRTRFARELGGRRFAVGFQLGGPVRADGVVEYFHKPIRPDGDEPPWPPDVPLADLLTAELGVPVHVFNDVHAFAALERWHGGHDPGAQYAVLVVRRGIGGVLVTDGEVDQKLVMEVGNLTIDSYSTGSHSESVEANGAEPAMVRKARELTGKRVETVEDAAQLADEPGEGEKAAFAFLDAGRELAKAVAAIQAVIRPRFYVLYVAAVLADEQRAAARAYRTGLDDAQRLVTYDPLRKPDIRVRDITRDKGARGAALVALEWSGVGHPATARSA